MIICSCNFLTDTEIRNCINATERPTVSQIFKLLNKQPDCGTCVKTIKSLINELSPADIDNDLPYVLVQSFSDTENEWIMTSTCLQTLKDHINNKYKSLSWTQNENNEWCAGPYIIKQFIIQ